MIVRVYQTYLLDIYEPEEKQISLAPRRQALKTRCGWEKQGQPFYSGEVKIRFGSVDIAHGARLELSEFHGIAELWFDGKPSSRSGLTLQAFELPAGQHELILRCWNTMANRMERYAAESGLTHPPVITLSRAEK